MTIFTAPALAPPYSVAIPGTKFGSAELRMNQPHAVDFQDMEQAEHCVLETEPTLVEGDDSSEDTARTISKKIEIRDRARGTATQFVLYEQGVLRVSQQRRKKRSKTLQFNLRYLDPVPSMTRHPAKRIFHIALGAAGAAAAAGLLAQFDVLRGYTLPSAIGLGTTGLIALLLGVYLTHQRFVFYTLHGRLPAIRLTAGFGYGRRFQALLPILSRAIEESADTIGDDTTVFLRQEMREHYRLRSNGVLTPEQCNQGTERILAQFDDHL